MNDLLKLVFTNGNVVSLVETSKFGFGGSRIPTYRMFFLINGSMSSSEIKDFSSMNEAFLVFDEIMKKAQQDNIADKLIDFRERTIRDMRRKTIERF